MTSIDLQNDMAIQSPCSQ